MRQNQPCIHLHTLATDDPRHMCERRNRKKRGTASKIKLGKEEGSGAYSSQVGGLILRKLPVRNSVWQFGIVQLSGDLTGNLPFLIGACK